MELERASHGSWPTQSHRLSGLLSREESLEGSREETEAAAEEAVEVPAEAVEEMIAAMQTTEAVDMPKEAEQTRGTDMEGQQ